MINKQLILEMFSHMDEDFKKQHEFAIKDMFSMYPCISLMKDDLIGYAENEYKTDKKTKNKMIEYIRKLDDDDMQNIADEFSNDSVMDSFWYFVEYQLELIQKKIDNKNDA